MSSTEETNILDQIKLLANVPGVYQFYDEKNNLLYYFVGIDKARFKKPVLPGDILIIEVNLIQSKRDVHKFNATCKVDDVVVCTAELLGAVREKNDT